MNNVLMNKIQMNKKLMFFSMIVAIAVVSIGAISATTQETQIEPQMIQTISSSVMDASLEQIAEHTEYAIVGEVTKIEPIIYTDPDRAKEKVDNEISGLIIIDREILSDVTIKVEEDLFGKYNEKFITVRVPGGEIPTQKTIHDQSTPFVKGERVIVFVGNGQSYSISEDNYTVIGLDQGTVRLDDKVVSKFATNGMSENDIKNKIRSLK